MPEHADIVDGERHEPKGASTAVAGQVLKSLGGGATTFSTLTYAELGGTAPSLSVADILHKVDTSDQLLASAGDTAIVTYGTAETSPGGSITVGNAGGITLNDTGTYFIRFEMYPGRTASGGVSTLFFRLLRDGVPGTSRAVSIDDAGGNQTLGFIETVLEDFAGGTVLQVEMLHDVDSGGSAGLVTNTPVTGGWSVSPSAVLAVSKLEVS